jgi:cyclic beta-1,2-glucan synthetase
VREQMAPHVRTSLDEPSGALIASQTWTWRLRRPPRLCRFQPSRFDMVRRPGCSSWAGTVPRPGPPRSNAFHLDNRTGAGLDPAAALQLTLTLSPGQQDDVVFLLGQAQTIEEVRQLVARYQRGSAVDTQLDQTRHWWDSKLETMSRCERLSSPSTSCSIAGSPTRP